MPSSLKLTDLTANTSEHQFSFGVHPIFKAHDHLRFGWETKWKQNKDRFMDFVWEKRPINQFESFSAKDSVREAAKQLPAFMWDVREKSMCPPRENRETQRGLAQESGWLEDSLYFPYLFSFIFKGVLVWREVIFSSTKKGGQKSPRC